MKKYSLFVVFTLIIFLALFNDVQGESFSSRSVRQNRNTINGFVFDSQRRPVAQVFIELQNDVYSTLARTKTDGSGRFFFGGLSAGRFYIRVLPYGTNLEEQTQEVEIVNFIAPGRSVSENVQKDFYLRVRGNDADRRTATGVVFVQDVPEQARKSYQKAVAEFDDKKVESGITELKNALQLFPNYYLALERLGNEFIKQQKYQDAQEVFKRAVTVNSRSYSGWYGLGYASYALKQSETAIEAAEKAVALNPNSIEALLILGISQRQAKLYDKAEKSLKQADKSAKGKSADVHWNLALLYAHNFKRFKEAADELELFLKVEPNAENADAIRKLIKQFREKAKQN